MKIFDFRPRSSFVLVKFEMILIVLFTYVPSTSFIIYLSSTVGVDLASPLLEDEDPAFPDFPPSAPFLLPNKGIFTAGYLYSF